LKTQKRLNSSTKKIRKGKNKIKSLNHESNDEPINLIYNGPSFLNNEYEINDSSTKNLIQQNQIDDSNLN
jgi:hypothetical protein